MRLLALTSAVVLALALSWWLMRGKPEGQGSVSHPASAAAPDAEVLDEASLAIPPGDERIVAFEPVADAASVDPPADEDPEVLEEDERSDAELLELVGLPPDTPLAVSLNRPGPPDPMEIGEAALHLRLLDRAKGEPLKSEVVLWRLGAPANAYWTAGDQDVARASVSLAGHKFQKLPAGEYRAVVFGERASAPHQPAFSVSGETEVTLFVERPGERPVRLKLIGAEFEASQVQAALYPITSRTTAKRLPPWIVRRRIQPSYDGFIFSEDMETDLSTEDPEWLSLRSTSTGFDLGNHPQDTRGNAFQRKVSLRANDWSGMFQVQNDQDGEILQLTIDLSAKNDGG